MSDSDSISGEEEVGGMTSEESVQDDDSDQDFEVPQEDSSSEAGDSDDSDVDQPGPAHGGIWLPIMGDDPGPPPIPFTAVPGPIHPPPAAAAPIDYVNMFITPNLMDVMVRETNRYAQQWIDTHQEYLLERPKSMVHQWIKQGPTSPLELRAFLGVVTGMGLVKKSTLSSYWDTSADSVLETPWFIRHFSRDRFQLLLEFLHFNNNEELPDREDPAFKLFKVQPLIDHFQKEFRRHYHPFCDISIDESMVGFRGKTPQLRQYMPKKHHARFGIKLWCVSESSTGYTSYFEVFKGGHNPEDAHQPRGPTYALVMRLLRECNFLNLGHHVGLDNYFSSPSLFRDLFDQQTLATGTVRVNRKGLPRDCLRTRLRNQEVSERRKGPLLCVAYKDGSSRPVLLSTAATAGYMQVRNRRGQLVLKPRIVTTYNKAMGGVDTSDSKLYAYLSERRTIKWTLKLAFALFGRALLNAYLIYDANTTDAPKLTRLKFMTKVVHSLANDHHPPKAIRRRRTTAEIQAARDNPQLQLQVQDQPQPQPGPFAVGHELVKLPPRKKRNCVAGHPNRVRSGWECRACNVGLCPGCFAAYHQRPRP